MNAKKISNKSAGSESAWSLFDLPLIRNPKSHSGDLHIAAPRAHANNLSILFSILISPSRWARLWLRLHVKGPSREFYCYREREAYIAERTRRIAAIKLNGTTF